jgi:hypothetical protein
LLCPFALNLIREDSELMEWSVEEPFFPT